MAKTLSRGDKVKTITEIQFSSPYSPNVKDGARGTVLEVKGDEAKVHFPKINAVWPETTCWVKMELLDKITSWF